MAKLVSLKRIVPRGLFVRSLLLMAIPLVVVQIVVVVVFYDLHLEKVTERLANAVAGETATLIDLLDRAHDEFERASALALARDRLDIDPRLIDGALLDLTVAEGEGLVVSNLRQALSERVRRAFVIDDESLPRDVIVRIGLDDAVLEVVVRRERLFSGTAYVTLLWMVGTSILLMGLAVHFLRKQVRPLLLLAEAAEAFGTGRIDVELVPHGAREVRRAAHAFLAMRERIQRQVQQRTMMLADVSHDLRTPLTRMKLELAMMPTSDTTENLDAEVRTMERMVEEYLAFARGEGTESPTPTDLDAMLANLAERTGARRPDIALQSSGKLTVEVRRDLLRRALGNLLDNALRHGRRIAISAWRHGRTIEIVVDDDGPGIPEAEREAVFRPFFRLDEARGVETGSVGLGLTIARDAVRRHGGDLTLGQAPMGGLRARVTLPA